MEEEFEKDLASRIATGDEEAVREMVLRFGRPLYAFIYREILVKDDAQDILQETWLRVVRGIHLYNKKYRFSTWLFQIAINLCRDYHRSKENKIKDFMEDIADQRELKIDSQIVEDMILKEEERKLKLALNRLSPKQREVLLLRYFHGKGEREVAQIVRCSEGTVKSRLHYAISKLRNFLK